MSSQLFYIDSSDRVAGTASAPSILLELDRDAEYTSLLLLSASIPKSFYIVVDGRNTFTLSEGATDYTITIAEGNYNRKSFQTELITQLNTAGAFTYDVTYSTSPETGRWVFSVSGNSGVQPVITTGEYFFEPLGFEESSTNVFVGDSLTSSTVINLQSETSLILRSDMVQSKNNNILQEIFVSNEPSLGVINFTQYSDHNKRNFSKNSSNVFSFYITDNYGNGIELNGLPFQLTLVVFSEKQSSNAQQKLDLINKLIDE